LGQWAGSAARVDGKSLPRSGEATLFLPGGAGGPAFLVTDNYNASRPTTRPTPMRSAVRISATAFGRPPVQGAWPTSEPVLAGAERVEVQKRLAALGLYAGESDGKLGSKTREAVRAFQLNRGLIADGYANPKLLKELRAAR
jgi:peptidoglycan hydrolase-like protein with peptidoglycan-binding domain